MKTSTSQLLILSLAGLFVQGSALAQDPEPFRRDDELTGRDFEYNEMTFLHHFSYRFRPDQEREWNRTRQGFRATAGSVRSAEFYVYEELRKRWELSETLFFDFRHKIDEDFDGRYDRTLTGLGIAVAGEWSATLLGDLAAEKENIDVHLETAWRDENGRRFRLGVVAPDATFNRKAVDAEYETKPLTCFMDAYWRTDQGMEFGTWANWNSRLKLQLFEEDLHFTYDQLSLGAKGSIPFGRVWRISLETGAEEGSRQWRHRILDSSPETADNHRPQALELIDDRDLKRRHFLLGVQLERAVTESLGAWIGLRHFELSESEDRLAEPTLDGKLVRKEEMLHSGIVWWVHKRVVLWPGVHLDFIDNRDDSEQESDKDLLCKITFPIEIRFANTAALTLDQTLRLDDPRSGGANVQLQVPF